MTRPRVYWSLSFQCRNHEHKADYHHHDAVCVFPVTMFFFACIHEEGRGQLLFCMGTQLAPRVPDKVLAEGQHQRLNGVCRRAVHLGTGALGHASFQLGR